MRFHRTMSRLLLLVACSACVCACSWSNERGQCARDAECGEDHFCNSDGRCLPRELAARIGAELGVQCSVQHGQELGCTGTAVCRMGQCIVAAAPAVHPPTAHVRASVDASTAGGSSHVAHGSQDASQDAASDASMVSAAPPTVCGTGTADDAPPLFGGLDTATPDGSDAVLLGWYAAADETESANILYRVFRARAPNPIDFTQAPAAIVRGATALRVSGLMQNQSYLFAVRAVDAHGQFDCNEKQLPVTPHAAGTCADFETDVQPMLGGNCIACHKGTSAPRALHLTSYAEVLAGGQSGMTVVPCQPELSQLFLKVSQDKPPFGERMPLGGPYLSASQIETLRTWIAQGASASCPVDPLLCTGTGSGDDAGTSPSCPSGSCP